MWGRGRQGGLAPTRVPAEADVAELHVPHVPSITTEIQPSTHPILVLASSAELGGDSYIHQKVMARPRVTPKSCRTIWELSGAVPGVLGPALAR